MKGKSTLFDGDADSDDDNVDLTVNNDFAKRLQVGLRSLKRRIVARALDTCTGKLSRSLPSRRMSAVQHNKQREELHRLQERHPEIAAKAAAQVAHAQQSDTEEDSSEEDEV